MKFDLPFGLYLPDDTFLVRAIEAEAIVRIARKHQPSPDPRLGLTGEVVELLRDRHGRLIYSTVTVYLPAVLVVTRVWERRAANGEIRPIGQEVRLTLATDDLTSSSGSYVDEAVTLSFILANRLVQIYRSVAKAFHIHEFSRDDIFRVDVDWYRREEWFAGMTCPHFVVHS